MARYSYVTPAGWRPHPFPPPHQGVQLRAPIPPNRPDSAALLLLEAVAPHGSLEEQLSALVREGCLGAEVIETSPPVRLRTLAYEGLAQAVRLAVPGPRPHPEVRLFALVDAAVERLPVVLIGGPDLLAVHKPAFDYLIASIGPADGAGGSTLGFWTE